MSLLKDKLTARLATRSEFNALRREVRRQRGVLARTRRQAARSVRRSIRLADVSRRQGASLRVLERQVARMTAEVQLLKLDYPRLSQHIAATDTRLELLADRVSGTRFEGDEAEHEESRSLVEEIRREHEQVRVRFQVISGYEERLARVERTISAVLADSEKD